MGLLVGGLLMGAKASRAAIGLAGVGLVALTAFGGSGPQRAEAATIVTTPDAAEHRFEVPAWFVDWPAPDPPPAPAPPPPPTPPAPAPAPAPAAPAPAPAPAPRGSVEDAIATYFGGMYSKALSVARCESTLNPSAVSPGGGNYGLFQINTVHRDLVASMGYSWDQILDPYVNSAVARQIYNSSGWSAWACG